MHGDETRRPCYSPLVRLSRLVTRKRSAQVGIGLGVTAVQLTLFAALGLVKASAPDQEASPLMSVTLVPITLERPPMSPPDPTPRPTAGGGAPSAPSVVRPTPAPKAPPEIVAPPRPAPEQPLVIGVSPDPTPSPQPAAGQGGSGAGVGGGDGDGIGLGRGGTPPMILRGPTAAEILAIVPPEARRARRPGRVSMNCVIRIDQQLDDCRVVSETPEGFGFAEAGLRAASYFRYRPPMTAAGVPIAGQRATITVMFGRQ